MARRKIGGAEGRRINREVDKYANLRRKQNIREERKLLIIACEDSKSAPLYFKAHFTDLKRNRVIAAQSLVIANHKHTDPCGVLQDLLAHPDNETYDHRWIVIDRDEENMGGGHTLENFNQAIQQAKSKNIGIAYANPCFEIWYLLHFEYRQTAIDRDKLCDRLYREHGYEKSQLFGKVFSPELQNKAIRNAERLIQLWIDSNGQTNPASDNPSTTVYELVKLLNSFKATS